jgi:radical SAM superfamily enzyme YgiQ (UPF0313 family)
MNILLIYPPKTNNQETAMNGLTLGLAYIAAFLNYNNHYTDIINAPYQGVDDSYIIEQISKNKYDLIGISMSVQEDVPDGIELSRKIKNVYPNIIIFVGGHFATHESTNILTHVHEIDVVIRGEGEKTTLSLIQALENGDPLCNLKGITYRDDGKVISNTSAELIEDLDVLPSPINELYKLSGLKEDIIPISAQRGCYGNCSFCSIVSFYGKSTIRRKSPRNVVDEIEEYHNRFGKKIFNFVDDNFVDQSSNSRKWINEFCNEIKKRNLKIKFEMILRVNDCTLDILKPLIDVGLYQVGIGVESFSENVLRRMNKKISLEDITKSIKTIRNLGITLIIYYIMFEPDMSFDDLYNNYIFLRMYGFFAPVYVFKYVEPYSGTPLRKKLIEENRLILSNWYEVGKYNFLDEKVQSVFNQLMKLKKAFAEIEKTHRENKLYYDKYIFNFLKLDYVSRLKIRDDIFEIIMIDKKFKHLETSILFNFLGNILKEPKNGVKTVSIQQNIEKTINEMKKILCKIEALYHKTEIYFERNNVLN